MTLSEYESPCGRLLLGVHGQSLCLCDWMTGDRIETSMRRINRHLTVSQCADDKTLYDRAARMLDEYFAGKRRQFDLPLLLCGTEFQQRIWKVLPQIPYGETVSYKDVAQRAGSPEGVRAVASAIGANPLSILIPCHRIIGADGTLTGYAGGLEAKRYLLRLECIKSGHKRAGF